MSISEQYQFKQRHPKMTHLPAWVKNMSMEKGGRAFRLAWIEACHYSAAGRKKVEAADAAKARAKGGKVEGDEGSKGGSK